MKGGSEGLRAGGGLSREGVREGGGYGGTGVGREGGQGRGTDWMDRCMDGYVNFTLCMHICHSCSVCWTQHNTAQHSHKPPAAMRLEL